MSFNDITEAMNRREADMRYIAMTISREIHRRDWTNHFESFDDINARLDYPMPELQQLVSVSARLKVQFEFSTSVVASGSHTGGPDTNESTLIEAADEQGDWDESFHSGPISNISRLIEVNSIAVAPID